MSKDDILNSVVIQACANIDRRIDQIMDTAQPIAELHSHQHVSNLPGGIKDIMRSLGELGSAIRNLEAVRSDAIADIRELENILGRTFTEEEA